MAKKAAQLDREINEILSRGLAHARSLFPSERERASDYLAEGGFEKLYTGKTKRGESFEIYGSPVGAYSIRLADSLREIGTAYLAEKWSNEPDHALVGLCTEMRSRTLPCTKIATVCTIISR